MFIKSYFSHNLHQCQWIHDTSMYFLYKKQILTKWNFNPILQFGSDNRILTIQLFSPNYSNSSNSIRKPENERIRIPNTTIRYQLFEYSNSSNNSWEHCFVTRELANQKIIEDFELQENYITELQTGSVPNLISGIRYIDNKYQGNYTLIHITKHISISTSFPTSESDLDNTWPGLELDNRCSSIQVLSEVPLQVPSKSPFLFPLNTLWKTPHINTRNTTTRQTLMIHEVVWFFLLLIKKS